MGQRRAPKTGAQSSASRAHEMRVDRGCLDLLCSMQALRITCMQGLKRSSHCRAKLTPTEPQRCLCGHLAHCTFPDRHVDQRVELRDAADAPPQPHLPAACRQRFRRLAAARLLSCLSRPALPLRAPFRAAWQASQHEPARAPGHRPHPSGRRRAVCPARDRGLAGAAPPPRRRAYAAREQAAEPAARGAGAPEDSLQARHHPGRHSWLPRWVLRSSGRGGSCSSCRWVSLSVPVPPSLPVPCSQTSCRLCWTSCGTAEAWTCCSQARRYGCCSFAPSRSLRGARCPPTAPLSSPSHHPPTTPLTGPAVGDLVNKGPDSEKVWARPLAARLPAPLLYG